MKNLIVAAILMLAPVQLSTQAAQTQPSLSPQELKIQEVIQHLQPKLNSYQSKELAQVVLQKSQKYKLEWKLLLSILNQESSLNKDPQGCLKVKTNCTGDYGVGQVRKAVWASVFKFDGRKLLISYDYAVDASAKILSHYKTQYGKKEMNWFTRYHSKNPELRAQYMAALNVSYGKINEGLDRLAFQPDGKHATLIAQSQ